MRDKRFVRDHREGSLKLEQHHQLMRWAIQCTEHVLPLLKDNIDDRLANALTIAKAWEKGKASVGDARKASIEAHTVARETINPIMVAIARAIGHAVATAHMADHSLGAALYALKAVKNAAKSVQAEREWQNEHLHPDIAELVLTNRDVKEKSFKL
ncbi:MAG: hypothetical protein JW891_18405 [Candidatus Lokiarchaeota archaeon]|nr:hypothetical protein [Candidatus Lokiarchaeota archaeon]